MFSRFGYVGTWRNSICSVSSVCQHPRAHTHTHTHTHTHSMGVPGGATPTTNSGATPTPTTQQQPQQQTPQGGTPNPAALQQAMAQVFGAAGGQSPPVSVENQQLAQAEILYQSQLEQLANMGFTNRQANLRGM